MTLLAVGPTVLNAANLLSTVREDQRLVELSLTGDGLILERWVVPLDPNGNVALEEVLRGRLEAQRAINQATPALLALATGAGLAGFPTRNKACSNAADGFKLYSQQENPPNTQDFIHKATAFRTHCLTPLDVSSTSEVVVSYDPERFIDPQVIGRALGVLMVGVAPVCTGMLVDGNRVLTAAHCLRNNQGTLTVLGNELNACAAGDTTNCLAYFSRASEPGNLLQLAGIGNLPSQPLWDPSTDFVTLDLVETVEGVPAVVKVVASAPSPQFLAGWSGFLGDTSGGPWSALMMYTSPDWPCAIDKVWAQTALHSCQTLRGLAARH
ncbi:MAG: trypsin-like serine protease [Lysobacterales bacterium]